MKFAKPSPYSFFSPATTRHDDYQPIPQCTALPNSSTRLTAADDERRHLKKKIEVKEEVDGERNSKETPPWSRKMMVEEEAPKAEGPVILGEKWMRLVKKSSSSDFESAVHCRFTAAGVIEPFISMLRSSEGCTPQTCC